MISEETLAVIKEALGFVNIPEDCEDIGDEVAHVVHRLLYAEGEVERLRDAIMRPVKVKK